MTQLNLQQAFNLALQHHQAGHLQQAEHLYRQILARNPRHADALHHLGLIARQVGRNDHAVELIRHALAINPNYPQALTNLANALRSLGKNDEAIDAYQKAIALGPDFPEIQNNLGAALQDKGDIDQAIAAYQKAIALRPDLPEAHNNLANAFKDQGNFDQAIASYQKAIELRPDYPEAYNNLGNVLQSKDRWEDAIAAHELAISFRPDYAEAYNNLGNAFLDAGRPDKALAAHERAVMLKPDFPEFHHNLALTLLLNGDFIRGWIEFEWRWKCRYFASHRRQFPQPQWDGSDLNNRTLLIFAEQGFGDTLQFIRFLPSVAKRNGKVILECQPELKRLLQTNAQGWQVISGSDPLPPFDVQCPLLSLPLMFGTTAHSIPEQVPCLQADPELVEKWKAALAGNSNYFKVGLAWAGNKMQKNDGKRSLSLSAFAPLAQNADIRFFSLQKGEAGLQANTPPPGMNLIDWTGELKDFADTAALIANLDLVITIDTAVAHLAGVMGKPVWTLLAHITDWRWGLNRTDNPWYPSMRIFRQPARGDWATVFAQVAFALDDLQKFTGEAHAR